MSKPKAYCIIYRPRLFNSIEEALEEVKSVKRSEVVKYEDYVVCLALGTPEPKFKILKGVFPIGPPKSVLADDEEPMDVRAEHPSKPKADKVVEPCTFCPKPATFTMIDPEDKKPFRVCSDHKTLAQEKLR